MTNKEWQPLENAPQDREFLAAIGNERREFIYYDVLSCVAPDIYVGMDGETLENNWYKILGWLPIPDWK
jgi:hypothetical protein